MGLQLPTWEWVHSLTLFALPRACDATPGSFSWLTTLHPLVLVVSPKLVLRQLIYYKLLSYFKLNYSTNFRIYSSAKLGRRAKLNVG